MTRAAAYMAPGVVLLGLLDPRVAHPVPALDPSKDRDYEIANRGWNGLSEFAELGGRAGCPLQALGTLSWDELSYSDVLLFLYPRTAPSAEHLLAFLKSGGRAVVADDFGQGAAALARLGITLSSGPLPAGVKVFRENRALALAAPARGTRLGRSAAALVSNHPAILRSSLEPTFAFAQGLGLVIEGGYHAGRFVALSDPSLFINNMLEVTGNREFARALLLELCRPGRDRVLVLHGHFRQRGAPPSVLPGTPGDLAGAELPARLNRLLLGLSDRVHQRLVGAHPPLGPGLGVASLCGLALTLAGLLLLLRYLPLLSMPLDPGFAHGPPAARGLFAQVALYVRREIPWGYGFPAALLREEVQRRLTPYHAEISTLPVQQVEAVISRAVSVRAGRLAARLWRSLGRIGEPGEAGAPWLPARFVSRRRLLALHRLAVALFAELDKRTGDDVQRIG